MDSYLNERFYLDRIYRIFRDSFNYFQFPEETGNMQSAFSGTNSTSIFNHHMHSNPTNLIVIILRTKQHVFAEGDCGLSLSSGERQK
jgi:hypothetical protein